MGSWNGTCGISQLPIMEDDGVAIFIMRKNNYNNEDHVGCVHSDNFYEPVSPAIFGKYADYGRVEVDNVDERIVISLYGEQHVGSENIGELIDKQSEDKGLYIMLIHRDLYEQVLEHFSKNTKPFTEGLPFSEFIKNEMINYLTVVRKDPNGVHIKLDRNHFKRDSGYALNYYQDHEIYKENLNEDPLIDEVVDLLTFKEAMQMSRKLWIPQAGQGSQDYELNVAKIIGKFAVKKENEDDEDYYLPEVVSLN